MFTISDLRTIAIQIERNGEAAYRRASARAKDPELKKLLARMADDEQKHLQWFESLKTAETVACELNELETLGQALLQDMMNEQTFSLDETDLARAENMVALLERSHAFEKDTILFYEMLHGFLEEAGAIAHLQRIIEEERAHVRMLREARAQKRDGA